MCERRHGWEDNIEIDFRNTVHRYGHDWTNLGYYSLMCMCEHSFECLDFMK